MVALQIDTQIKQHTNPFLCAKPTIGIDPAKYWLLVVALHTCTIRFAQLKEYIPENETYPAKYWLPMVALHTNTWTHKYKK